jgi:hypothetical protein
MKNYRIIKGKKIHVNQLASMSRKYTVNNNTVPQSELNKKNLMTLWHEIRTLRFDIPVYGNTYEIDADGNYHLIEEVDRSWKHERHKQPKRLIKCKKRKYSDVKSYSNQHGEKTIKRGKLNDFVESFPNYPYTIKPMSKEAYWEKLVAHKLEKWEKKNPKPSQDLFDKVEDWDQRQFMAEQRFRDFVVSCYNKLELNGRFKKSEQKYTEEKVAEIKDINMEGHHVNELGKDSKLLKKAQKITDETKKKNPKLVATNLKDHKKQKGRIILPQAA